MKLCGVVCCLSVAILAAPSMGRELPTAAIIDTPNIHHTVHHTAGLHRPHPKSCRDVTHRVSGVHRIQPEWPFQEPMLVYCDQDYESGGWTVIQRRIDGTVDFERTYLAYVEGFGNIDDEFWLGIENIYRLVKSAPHELVVLLEDFSGNTSYAKYTDWDMRYSGDYYSVNKCGSYSGSAGEAFCGRDSENAFDQQNTGGFWKGGTRWGVYGGDGSNLNGRYVPHKEANKLALGLFWGDFKAGSIKTTKMMIRPTKPKE